MEDLTKTRVFSSEDMRREMIRSNLKTVIDALNERGYNAVHQIAGYLISNDPAYISSHKNARNIIQQVERDEIIEELVEEDTTEEATYKEIGPKRLVLRRFFRSKLSIVGIVMIVLLFLFSFLGPVIYQKWGESTVDRSSTVKVLETPHTWTDEDGNKIQVIEELTIITEINSYADPSKDHFLGTDDKGMDVFARLMYGLIS